MSRIKVWLKEEMSCEMKENEHSISFKMKYCRMCAWELKQGVLIFGEEGKRLQIPEKIRKTLAILVLEEDNLPKKICTDCCSSLEDYALYKDTVLDAQEKLAAIAKVFPPPIFPPVRVPRLKESRTSGQDLGNPYTQSPHIADIKPTCGDANQKSSPKVESIATVPDTSLASTLTCKECGKKFRTRTDFDYHSSTAHSTVEAHSSTSVRSKLSLSTVTVQESPPPSPAASASPFEPEPLGIMTVDIEEQPKDSKAGILRIISPKNKIGPISECKVEYPNQSESKIKKVHQCIYCDKVLKSKAGMYTHMMTHKGIRYDCKDCGKSYAQKVTLTDHIKSQHTEKPVGGVLVPPKPEVRFKCSLCPSTFKQKSSLTEHTKNHTQSRPFECTFCNKSYKSDKCLRKHLRSHAPYTFACSLCDKRFWRKSKLDEHENVHTDRRPFGCNFCIKTFNSQPNYFKHVRRKHQLELKDGKIPPPIKADAKVLTVEKKSPVKNIPPVTRSQTQGLQENTNILSHTESVNIYNEQADNLVKVHQQDVMASSPTWVDLTGKQQHRTSPLHINSEEPIDMNHSQVHSHQQQQLHTHQHHQQTNSHVQQQQQQQQTNQLHQQPHPQTNNQHESYVQLNNQHHQFHSQGNNLHQQQTMYHTNNHNQHQQQSQNQTMSQHQQSSHGQTTNQHHQTSLGGHTISQHQQHPSNLIQQPPLSQVNNQHQQQPHGQPNAQHQQHSHGQSNAQHQQHSHGQSNAQNQQHSHGQSNAQNQQHSHGQSNTQHQQQSHPNNHQQHPHLLQLQTQSQQHYNHHSQLHLQPLPLPLSSHHYPHTNHTQTSNTMDLVTLGDCAVQSGFVSEPTVTTGQQQNHPMELSYKLDTAFQDMPMELTKVFQSGPLELCVRNDFNQLVDLTAKEPNFNDRMSIMDFRQQPMDLISRNEVCGTSGLRQSDNNNLVDLSLRSSFQDQSESSFLRELIDLSSRSDYHGELNLSSKGHLSHSHKGNSLQNVVYSDAMLSLQN